LVGINTGMCASRVKLVEDDVRKLNNESVQ